MSAVLTEAFPSNLNDSSLPLKSKKKKNKLVAVPRVSTNGDVVMEERDASKSNGNAKSKRKRGAKDLNFAKPVENGEENAVFPVKKKKKSKKKKGKSAVVENKEREVDENLLDGAKGMVLEDKDEEEEKEESYLSNTRFDEYSMSPSSLKGIKDAGYVKMTKVQEATLPLILKGRDVLAKAKTGTGKTVAFLLPVIEVICKLPCSSGKASPINMLILCPTRELATQVAAEAKKLLKYHSTLGAQVVIGGTRMTQEQRSMQANPCQILIATPGRLTDHIENTPGFRARLKDVKVLVLDEADQLLDMGFKKAIERIITALPKERQTLLFSATVPKEVRQICHVALRKDHEFINTVEEGTEETHALISQTYLTVPLLKQFPILYQLLTEHISQDPDYKVIIFCTTAMVTKLVAEFLGGLKLNVREIHSRKTQSARTKISQEFRQSKGLILVSSDVSARGVDYPDVTLVIQMGIPSNREQYIHRLGRTGRKGKEGQGILMLAPWEICYLNTIKDLPVTEAAPCQPDPACEEKVSKALACTEMKSKERAYQAWLGYYNSHKSVGKDKLRLVELARQFSESMGLQKPPPMQNKILSKMGLLGVPGFLSV